MMKDSVREVLQYVEQNDVKFIRLAFCDIFGRQKNISITPRELPRAFESGISFDASAIYGFTGVEQSDLFLLPDEKTLSVLPWRPSQGRVIRLYSSIVHPNGSAFEADSRTILKKAVSYAAKKGYLCKIGTECEFYLFENNKHSIPTNIPHDFGGYCDISPLDKGENIRRQICLTLEEMGILPERSHHEQGPGQNEIDFHYGNALTAADNFITFRSATKAVAFENGLFASFLPKPFANYSGSGMHVNLSLYHQQRNLFESDKDGNHSLECQNFLAGILSHIQEMTLFLNPLTNSYHRFGAFEAPKYITWSHQNRSQLVRIPAARGQYSRMELRSPDMCCNPYLAFSLLIYAGLDGIEQKTTLCPSTDIDLYNCNHTLSHLKKLPMNLGKAIQLAEQSTFLTTVFPEKLLQKYLLKKKAEWSAYCHAKDKQQLEHELYFNLE